VFGQVLVARDARSLESLGRQLLLFVGNHVCGEREFVDTGALATQVKDADLRVRNTAAVAGFRVRLILAVAVAPRGAFTSQRARVAKNKVRIRGAINASGRSTRSAQEYVTSDEVSRRVGKEDSKR
jgi:hypothetical protein